MDMQHRDPQHRDLQIDLTRLGDFFAPEDLEWKPITVSKKTNKGLAAAYITARAIMDRLDEVCGPANWRNEFRPGPDGGVLCGISIRVGEAPDGSPLWVTKWDGAENTDIEAVKGGLSSAMRRAAVHWGIGRYLYRLPQQWVPVDERGRFAKPPAVPAAFLPPAVGDGASTADVPAPAPSRRRLAQRPEAQRPEAQRPEAQRPEASRPEPRGGARPQRPAPESRPAPTKDDGEFFMPQDLPF